MKTSHHLTQQAVLDTWDYLNSHPLNANAYRIAFADPEFMLRREARGIRMQLELLKPELDQKAQGIENTVVVFGSARFCSMEEAITPREKRNAYYYEQARAFGNIVATANKGLPSNERMTICTGGGPGIMEAANRGASEAGELTVGLNIALPHEQNPNPYITPSLSFKFHYFALRKMHFMMRAKAMVAFPGGFGTLDELFEVITLVQTHKASPVPIILFGTDYWSRLFNWEMLVEEGVIDAHDLKLIQMVDEPQAAWDAIVAFHTKSQPEKNP